MHSALAILSTRRFVRVPEVEKRQEVEKFFRPGLRHLGTIVAERGCFINRHPALIPATTLIITSNISSPALNAVLDPSRHLQRRHRLADSRFCKSIMCSKTTNL